MAAKKKSKSKSKSQPKPRFDESERSNLYAASRFIDLKVEKKLGLRITLDVYFQDPLVAKQNKAIAFDDKFAVRWEPGLSDGPTSARFAVVDYNSDTDTLAPPALWRDGQGCFLDADRKTVDRKTKDSLQFHQVNVWAIVQNALDFYESGFGLGRRIPWGFEGNRLIVVPHAGYGENAFYDRESKSLQFYYFGENDRRVYTCLSTDIVNHEFGHAILDGIRPYFIEAHIPETGAFHEFIGDLTAILIAFRNNKFRKQVAADTGGDLSNDNVLASIADQFGTEITDKPYLRTGLNDKTMSDVANDPRPHFMSQVLTGAMFDIIRALTKHYQGVRGRSLNQALWDTIQRMQRMAIQPLDLLPPADVTFRDYALAVLRAEKIENPVDPHGFRELILDTFIGREILDKKDRDALTAPGYVFDRPDLAVFHDINTVATSKAEAYRFLDDNRKDLFIPPDQDFIVADLYTAEKFGREARRQPRQIIIQYVWREDVRLEGERFGQFDGRMMTMLCGGTLAFDENGNLLSWARKPGSKQVPARRGKKTEQAKADAAEGVLRREELLDTLARRVRTGGIGSIVGGARGMLGTRVPPFTSRDVDGTVRFELTPHLGIHADGDDIPGGREWEISS